MKPKVIKTEADYEAALARIDKIFTAKPGTADGDELELLTMLVEVYEDQHYSMDLPDPLTAIRFRMEQAGLKQKDLAPFIGSPAKVSEVLSGKRQLTKTMIRNLSEGLGIPAEVLLQEVEPSAKAKPPEKTASLSAAEWRFPFTEMFNRGWFADTFNGTLVQAKAQKDELLRAFVAPLNNHSLNCALNRQSVCNAERMDAAALEAWRVRVATLALRENLPTYTSNTVTPKFLAEVAHLSYLDKGPLLAREFLNKNGIHLIIEKHLAKTRLDGAALKLPNCAVVIALTLRHDRLDNFWFTLCHELAHVALHLDQDDTDAFFDDLSEEGTSQCEREANEMGREALIPKKVWEKSGLQESSSADDVRSFASELRIHPAIPAGRIRFESHDYHLLSELVGNGQVRCLFAS